ncbi:MAG: PKD domain-containing protein [Bacteroidetes bacterium]|nr:PKD domain-containing protein [Bacteroidota bacterium]
MALKKLLFIFFYSLFFFLTISANSQTSDTIKVLFIGNSFTYVNDLPQTFAQLSIKAGKIIYVDNNTIGGYTLKMHLQNAITIQKIYSQKWNYVVLQEQSQIPSFIPERDTMMYPYAIALDSLIHDNSPCTQTVFFMTWAHKNGDLGLPIGSDTYEDMQQRLRSGYMQIADSLNAIVVPCGWSWRKIRQNYPSIELYSSDNYHPAENGTYLAACSFYASIFRQSAVGINYIGNVLPMDAVTLQTTASQVVLDSLSLWNIGLYNPKPIANFGFFQNGNQIQFSDSSSLADVYTWDFGDGNHSNLQNPFHTYTSSATYNVKLIVSNNCGSDTISKSFQYFLSDIIDKGKSLISIYPNPSKDIFNIKIPIDNGVYSYEVINPEGKIIIHSSVSSSTINNLLTINLTNEAKNIYYLTIYTQNKPLRYKLFKF